MLLLSAAGSESAAVGEPLEARRDSEEEEGEEGRAVMIGRMLSHSSEVTSAAAAAAAAAAEQVLLMTQYSTVAQRAHSNISNWTLIKNYDNS